MSVGNYTSLTNQCLPIINNNEDVSTSIRDAWDSPITYTLSVDYDHAIHVSEKNYTKIMLYELIGLSRDMLNIEVEFINKTKITYLKITGEYTDKLTGWKNDINIYEKIDTNIYCGYEVAVKDGILTLTLYEIINDRPRFVDFDK